MSATDEANSAAEVNKRAPPPTTATSAESASDSAAAGAAVSRSSPSRPSRLSSSSREKFSCGHSTASTASPTLRLPTYQNYRKRSSVIGRSRTLAGTGRRGAAVTGTGCQCGKSGATGAAPATESGEFVL